MKIGIHVVLGILISFSGYSKNLTNPHFDIVASQKTEIDLNNDGVIDVFRKFDSRKLIEMIYVPSWRKGHKEVTLYKSSTDYSTTFYEHDVKKKTKRIFSNKNVDYSEIETLLHPSKLRTTIRYVGEIIYKKKYKFVNRGWVLIDEQSMKVSLVENPAGADTGLGQAKRGRSNRKQGPRSDYGPPLDNSCDGFDRKIIESASNLMFRKSIPCLSKLNPKIAFELAKNLRLRQNRIFCDFDLKLKASKNHSSKKPKAYGSYKRNGNIVFVLNTPSKLKKNMSKERLIKTVANTLLHEYLHTIRVFDGGNHKKKNAGKYSDAVFACTTMCAFPSTHNIDFKSICETCVNTKLGDRRAPKKNLKYPHQCSKEFVKTLPYASELLRRVKFKSFSKNKLCNAVGGKLVETSSFLWKFDKCLCADSTKPIDPLQQNCPDK